MLSFISRQVAERYQSKIAKLALQTGWRLSVNPQPNQGAILEVARALLVRVGLTISKGPSIYPEKAEVSVTMASAPTTSQEAEITEAFERETGFHLIMTSPTAKKDQSPRLAFSDVVEIPVTHIRLSGYHQSVSLDPVKLEKAIERARMMGITPPIQVRRTMDGYILSDGLYRLRAAESLSLERIPAVVE